MPRFPPAPTVLLDWLRYRRYAVPGDAIDRAAELRRAGDWRGACAAAGVALALDERLPAAAEHDLRHLAPDLLLWHLPQMGYETWEWYDRAVPLARYPDGSALMVRERHSPQPQRRLVLSFARSVPRAMLEIPRQLWDDRRSADLRDACGAALSPAGIDVTRAPRDFLEQPWVWPRLVPAAEALLERMNRGRPAGRRTEPVVRVAPDLYLDLRGHEPALRPGGPETGGPPHALRPVEWAEPLDAVLLRSGLLTPGELHPLVHAALLPGRPYRRRPPDLSAAVTCAGATHRLAVADGELQALDHTRTELARELTLASLGGTAVPCALILRSWRTGEGVLPDTVQRLHDELWQRVRHGDTAGAARLLEHGFPPVPDRGGATLMHALDHVDHELLLPLLLRLGLDVNARAAGGRTPLPHLLRRGFATPDLIGALLRAGADPGLRDADGRDAHADAGPHRHLLNRA